MACVCEVLSNVVLKPVFYLKKNEKTKQKEEKQKS